MPDTDPLVRLALKAGLVSPVQVEAAQRIPGSGVLAELVALGHLSATAIEGLRLIDRGAPDATRVAGQSSTSSALSAGSRLGAYELIRELGRGGMGAVYLARHTELQRSVALKVLLPGATSRPEDRERFRREVRAAASLKHPNVVTVHDVGEENGTLFYTMEFLDGTTLSAVLTATGALPVRLSLRIGRDTARALGHAHAQGFIHRDVKPGNVMLVPAGAPAAADATGAAVRIGGAAYAEFRSVLTDFGLARPLDASSGVTITGEILGTPRYMSPEQASGGARTLDARSDVFSLGVMLYEMLAGAPPFVAEDIPELFRRIATEDAVPLRSRVPSVSRDVETIVAKALEKDPARRYADGTALAEDLDHCLRGEAILARPASLLYRGRKFVRRHATAVISSAAVFVLLAAFAAYLLGPASFDVRSTPTGASIWIDGRDLGATTPAIMRVWPPGRHHVALMHPDSETAALDLEFAAWRRQAYTAALIPAFGDVVIETRPAGAAVTFTRGAESVAAAPGRTRLRAGLWKVRAVLAASRDTNSVIDVVGGKSTPLLVELPPRLGTLDADAAENDVEMTIVGGGETRVLRLPSPPMALQVGRYRARFAKPRHWPEEHDVIVAEGATSTAHASMIPMELWTAPLDADVIQLLATGDLDSDGITDIAAYCADQHVHAFSGATGVRLWETRVGGVRTSAFQQSARRRGVIVDAIFRAFHPFLAAGDLDRDGVSDLLVESAQALVVAISGRDGRILWRREFDVALALGGASILDLDGDGWNDALLASMRMEVMALDGRTGVPRWALPAGAMLYEPPRVTRATDGFRVVAATASIDGEIVCRRGSDGSVVWRRPLKGDVRSLGTGDLDGDAVDEVMLVMDDRIFALSAEGETLWATLVGGAERVEVSPAHDVWVFTGKELVRLDGGQGQVQSRCPWSPNDSTAAGDRILHAGATLHITDLKGINAWSSPAPGGAEHPTFLDPLRPIVAAQVPGGIFVAFGASSWVHPGASASPVLADLEWGGDPEVVLGDGARVAAVRLARPPIRWRHAATRNPSVLLGGEAPILLHGSAAHALDPADGRRRWSSSDPERDAGGAVLWKDPDGRELLLLSENGKALHVHSVAEIPLDDGEVHQATEKDSMERSCGVRAIDASTGRDRWSTHETEGLAGVTTSTHAPITLDGAAFLARWNGVLAVDPVTGRKLWFKTFGHPACAPLPMGAALLVRSTQGLIAVDPKTGAEQWSYAPGIELRSVRVGTSVIACGTDVVCLDVKTGRKKWSAAIAEARVRLVDLDLDGDGVIDPFILRPGGFSILNGASGIELASSSIPKPPTSVIAFGGGAFGLTLADGLVMIDTRPPLVRWQYLAGLPLHPTLLPVQRGGLLIVPCEHGALALDAKSGALLWWLRCDGALRGWRVGTDRVALLEGMRAGATLATFRLTDGRPLAQMTLSIDNVQSMSAEFREAGGRVECWVQNRGLLCIDVPDTECGDALSVARQALIRGTTGAAKTALEKSVGVVASALRGEALLGTDAASAARELRAAWLGGARSPDVSVLYFIASVRSGADPDPAVVCPGTERSWPWLDRYLKEAPESLREAAIRAAARLLALSDSAVLRLVAGEPAKAAELARGDDGDAIMVRFLALLVLGKEAEVRAAHDRLVTVLPGDETVADWIVGTAWTRHYMNERAKSRLSPAK